MINYFGEDVSISFLKHRRAFSRFLKQKLGERNLLAGDINYIFCSDEYMININQQYLNHDYYTDTITFNYSEGNNISGDIFISFDRVCDNAENFGNSFLEELFRVMIHGFLHLLGYEDKKSSESSGNMTILQEVLLKEFLDTIVSRET